LCYRFGEAPRAYLVAKPGDDLTEAEVHDFMKEKAAAYKQLVGGIEFLEQIPKTASGKILRKEILAEYNKLHGG
jgi:4-coumarate--CoA ligase